jgi:hypothetical protein
MSDSIEKIRRHIKAFQTEQEASLVRGTYSSSSSSGGGNLRAMKMVTGTSGGKGKGRDDNPLSKYLDVDCFLLCGFASKSTFYGKVPGMLWPVALVAQLSEKFADLGHLETHGSLWRVLKTDSGLSGPHAYLLQSSVSKIRCLL